MLRKLCVMLGIAVLFSSAPITGFSQDKEDKTETHTGVKRTYKKAKHKVRHAWHKTKSAVSGTYNKAKTRATTDDNKSDATERK
jgi:hypothetical protein